MSTIASTMTVPVRRTGQVRQVRPARQELPSRTATAARRQAGPVRLTRRGRLLVTLVLTMLVLGVFLLAGGSSVATREAGDPQPIRTVEVQSGQTLWAIASEIAEPGEVREMVYTIQRLNSLPDATLTEGQVLAVPAE